MATNATTQKPAATKAPAKKAVAPAKKAASKPAAKPTGPSRFVAWSNVDTRTIVGATMRSSRKGQEGEKFVVDSFTVGKQWVSLFDKAGVQHCKVPVSVVTAYMEAADAGTSAVKAEGLVEATAAHVAALDGVDKATAKAHAVAVLSGKSEGAAATAPITSPIAKKAASAPAAKKAAAPAAKKAAAPAAKKDDDDPLI